jgi:2-amino-4-hydroxy-6-hydroxymethyldihydropteridine diphosphokinase
MEHTAYIGLGSNLGDRRRNLDGALAELDRREDICVVARSSYHETEPVGGPPGQGMYLNGAAALRTNLSPEGLLQALLEVEQLFGRVRREPNGPRTLDLDLLLYDDLVRVDAPPLVPHPRMAKRRFVLEPLSEIAGHVRHPVLGVTIRRLVEARTAPRSTPCRITSTCDWIHQWNWSSNCGTVRAGRCLGRCSRAASPGTGAGTRDATPSVRCRDGLADGGPPSNGGSLGFGGPGVEIVGGT